MQLDKGIRAQKRKEHIGATKGALSTVKINEKIAFYQYHVPNGTDEVRTAVIALRSIPAFVSNRQRISWRLLPCDMLDFALKIENSEIESRTRLATVWKAFHSEGSGLGFALFTRITAKIEDDDGCRHRHEACQFRYWSGTYRYLAAARLKWMTKVVHS